MKEPIPKDVSDFTFETDDFTLSCITKTPEEKEKPPVLIENILYKSHSMLFYGPSKSFKSFLLLMLAVAIATGGEWLGFKCSQGNVLIIEFENGLAMTYDRLKLILDENNIDKKYLSRISIVTLKKRADINTLVDGLIKNIPPEKYSAIIVDPVYKLLSGCESQAEIVHSVFARIDELSKALDASVIVCHHTKKEGQTYQNFIDKISGSSLMGRDSKKAKAQGGKRVMYTTHRPCWDAKNRHGLPDKLDFDFKHIAHVIPSSGAYIPVGTEIKTETPLTPDEKAERIEALKAKIDEFVDDDSAPAPDVPSNLAELMNASGIKYEEIQKVVEKEGYFPEGTPIKNYGEDFINGWIIAYWSQITDMIIKNR